MTLIAGGLVLVLFGVLLARYGDIFYARVHAKSRWRRILYAQWPPFNRTAAWLFGAAFMAIGIGLFLAGIVAW